MKYVIAMILFVPAAIRGQQKTDAETMDASILNDAGLAISYENPNEEAYENYLQLLSAPLDINAATEERLQTIPYLTAQQAKAIQEYKRSTGNFLSLYELQTIDAIDETTRQNILPFLTVALPTEKFISFRNFKNKYVVLGLQRTLEKKAGFNAPKDEDRFLGGEYRHYFRARLQQPESISIGIQAEKDVGEPFRWNKKTWGYDFVSFHLQRQRKRKLQNIIVGDYSAQFGQGLTLGTLFAVGKNANAVQTLRRFNLGFLPYTSLYETNFFRGIAASYALSGSLISHAFYSLRDKDGSLSNAEDEISKISSLSSIGLHRNEKEQSRRHAVTEQNMGGILQFRKKYLDVGLLWHHTRFNTSIVPTERLYTQLSFSGKTNTNVGAYAHINLSNVLFYTEISHSLAKGLGMVGGITASLSPKLDITIHARSFATNFYSFYSNAISEYTSPNNEKGIIWAMKYYFNRKTFVTGYVDFFRTDAIRYNTYAPSEGYEWVLRFQSSLSRQVRYFIQWRQENKRKNSSEESLITYILKTYNRQNYWLQVDYAPSLTWKFSTRMQTNFVTPSGDTPQTGWLCAQDMQWQSKKISITSRIAIFDAENYETRTYSHEPDVWMAFSFPAYYGRGVRTLILAEYKISRKISLAVRWAQTRYADRENIGNGLEQYAGNTRNDLKIQAAAKF